MQFAVRVQEALVGDTTISVSGALVSGRSVPQFAVGGDCFDLIPLPNGGLRITIADVMGKGFGVAMLMTMFRTAVRMATPETDSPGALLRRLNRQFYGDLQRLGSFLTAACIDYSPSSRQLTMASAGHPYPLLLRTMGDTPEPIKVRGVSVGMMPDSQYMEVSVSPADGDKLVLFTDGVVEARNAEGSEFSAKGLASAIARLRGLPAEVLVPALLDTVAAFATESGVRDDVTLVAADFAGPRQG